MVGLSIYGTPSIAAKVKPGRVRRFGVAGGVFQNDAISLYRVIRYYVGMLIAVMQRTGAVAWQNIDAVLIVCRQRDHAVQE
jgi:hypothetical protein